MMPTAERSDDRSPSWSRDDLDRYTARLGAATHPDTTRPPWDPSLPSVFDVTHDETALFYATNRGVSRCLVGADLVGEVEHPRLAHETISKGYTTLYTCEKRAVVADGEVIRYWAEASWREHFTRIPRFPETRGIFADRPGEERLEVTLSLNPPMECR